MCETIFPQSPNWNLSKIITTREDGSVAYGAQSNVFILERHENTVSPHLIYDAHTEKVTSVTFSPNTTHEKIKNRVLSTSEDGFVKLTNIGTNSCEIGHNAHSPQKQSEPAKVVCGAWSQCNPKYVASVADNDTIVLWDILDNTATRFLIPKLKPSVVEYSYHHDKIVAVGSKSGLVYIIKLHKKGEVIYRLRGHDKEVQSLSWCPTFSNTSKSNDIMDHFLLASSSGEKEICIWQTIDGACEGKIQLPKAPFSKRESHNYRKMDWDNFTPLFWASSDFIYVGTRYGEVICCDVKLCLTSQSDSGKNVKPWKLIHSYHSNEITALAGVPVKHRNKSDDDDDDGVNDKIRNDLRSIECNDSKMKNSHVKAIGQGNETNDGTVEEKEFDTSCLESKKLIWTMGKDSNLIAVYNDFDTYNPLFRFQSINGHPFQAVVSPHDPNKIGICGGDGKIRLWNASKSSSDVRVFCQNEKGRVYSLAWHPHKEGLIAYGTSEGIVGLIDVYNQKKPGVFNVKHHGKVYRLCWGPPYSENVKDYSSSSGKKELCLYSIGGNNLILNDPVKLTSENLSKAHFPFKKLTDLCWKHDYSVLALGCARGNVYLLKPPKLDLVYTLSAFKNSIQSLVWHPTATDVDLDCSSFHGYFTFGSTDNEPVIKVYNYVDEGDTCKVEQVAALKGHSSYIQFVCWSPHVAGRLVSSSGDFSVRIWDVTTQTQLFKCVASQSTLLLFSVWSPIDPDIVITGFAERLMISWRIPTESGSGPLLKDSKKKKSNNFRMSETVNCPENETTSGESNSKNRVADDDDGVNLILATQVDSQKKTKEIKLFSKAWRSDVDSFDVCYGLLKEKLNGSGKKFTLPFLEAENEFLELLNTEGEIHQKSNNWSEYYQMALWRGNLKDVIEEKIAGGHLDDFLMSLVPCVSPRLWQESCLAYSKSLCEKKNFRKAACYLLAIHRVHEAINLLSNADYHLEAICIARCRLPESDPIFNNIVRRYADWLTKTGNIYKASECFIYLNDMPEVARILSKKNNNPECLSLAAIAAQNSGQLVLESECAYNALLLSLETLKWNLASRICDDHPDLKHLLFLYKTHTVIYDLDKEVLKLEKDVVTHLREEIGMETSYPAIYNSLSCTCDKNNLFTDKNKLYLSISLELSLACTAGEEKLVLSHIIRAMNGASRYMKKGKETHPLYKLGLWLSPNGYLARDGIFCRKKWTEENVASRMVSLRAFLCQAIVEHLDSVFDENEERFVCDVNDAADSLKELIHDVLNKDTFNYFQNQVEIKSVERTIIDACRRKNENAAQAESSKRDSECKEDDGEGDLGGESDGKKEKIHGEIIAGEREKMNRLKADIKNFESERIIAPNPAVVYCILRKVCRAFPQQGTDLVNLTETKWKELETK